MNRNPRAELTPADRAVAVPLAAIWLAAGAAACTLAVARRRWLLLLPGAAAVWYGLVWARVVRTRRRLDRLWPLRR